MNMKGGFVGSGQGIMRRLTCIQSHDKSLHGNSLFFCSSHTFRYVEGTNIRSSDVYAVYECPTVLASITFVKILGCIPRKFGRAIVRSLIEKSNCTNGGPPEPHDADAWCKYLDFYVRAGTIKK